jgi:DNA modification methylase
MAQLSPKSTDHVITDPPYENNAHTGQIAARAESRNRHLTTAGTYSGLSFPAITQWQRHLYAREFVRLSRGWIIVFCQVDAVGLWREALEAAGAKWRRACAWVKPNAMPQFSGDRPGQGEEHFCCAWAGESGSKWNGGGKIGLYFHPIPRGDKRFHETQKPFSLMVEILEDFTNEGELVLDPFAGSGTTLIASKALNRRFIGFETNPEYCKVANERITSPDSLPERFQGSQLPLL